MTSTQSSARYKWHRAVLGDHHKLMPAAILLAGFVMHSFDARDGGIVTVSIRKAAKHFRVARSTMQRGCWQLEGRGWLVRVRPLVVPGSRTPSARFALGDGPEGEGCTVAARGLHGRSREGCNPAATKTCKILV